MRMKVRMRAGTKRGLVMLHADQEGSRLSLLPSFAMSSGGQDVQVGGTTAKALVYVALQDQAVDRSVAAGVLWPHVRDARAAANLRTTLWRITQATQSSILDVHGSSLRIDPTVAVDLHRAVGEARRIVGGVRDVREMRDEVVQATISLLTTDLLTNWYDDWLMVHKERWRQLRLHALDAIGAQLTQCGRCALAVDAATASVDAEPLRESGYRCLMQAHLAQGNVSEAVRTHRRYSELLDKELGIRPSHHMTELLTEAIGV